MINLEEVTFRYPDGTSVFLSFNWKVSRGEAWSVLGPSGCGKTTLLYLLAGLLFPTSGEITINNQALTRPRPETGLILQDYGLLPWATVRRNAELGLDVRKFYGPDGKHTPDEYSMDIDVVPWLNRLGLLDIQNQYPHQISGGQRQRTAIARTLSLQPDLLLMDEPFSSLDAPTRESMQKLALELWVEQKLTLIIVTHAIEEAAALGQKILLLQKPPNTNAVVIDNPAAIKIGFRETEQYNTLVKTLRQRMETS